MFGNYTFGESTFSDSPASSVIIYYKPRRGTTKVKAVVISNGTIISYVNSDNIINSINQTPYEMKHGVTKVEAIVIDNGKIDSYVETGKARINTPHQSTYHGRTSVTPSNH